MAEEHEFQAPEGHKLCANNCGFFGSLTTSDLCSKCHRDLRMKAEQNAIAKAAFDDNNTSKSSPSPTPLTASESSVVIPALRLPESAAAEAERADLKSVSAAVVQVQPIANRCVACKRRVGLTGFKCRCESTFCGAHRYPEKHGCTFDYKSMGKAAIAKANPVVKAAKLHKKI